MDFNRNYASIFYRFRVIASYLSKVTNFNVPHASAFGASVGVNSFEFAEIFGNRNLESMTYRVALFAWFYVQPFY